MIAVIETISGLLCRERVTVQDAAQALGEVVGGGGPGVPLKVRPVDPAVRSAQVVREGQADDVSHVDLTPARPFPLGDLVAAFGAYHAVRRSPNPDQPPRVRFTISQPGLAHSAAIYAAYEEGEHGASDATVIAVMIRRD